MRTAPLLLLVVLLPGPAIPATAAPAAPNNAVVPVEKLEKDFYDWHQRHARVLETLKQGPVDLVFIGDSITHMFGGEPRAKIRRGAEIWDRHYGNRNAVNLGFGWDRTQNVLWRLQHGELDGIAPRVAVLLIGTNNLTGTRNARTNTPAEIAEGIAKICRTIRAKVPGCHVVLMGVLPRRSGGKTPDRFVKPIREINAIIAKLGAQEHVTFLDLTDRFADADGLPRKELMADTVHPNAAGYRVWAEALEPILQKHLGDIPRTPVSEKGPEQQGSR